MEGWWAVTPPSCSLRLRQSLPYGLAHLLQAGACHERWILFPVLAVEQLEREHPLKPTALSVWNTARSGATPSPG